MFKRRKPRNILQNTRELFWPSMGWIRAVHYTKHRITRLSDSTHKIAAGLAIGAAVSFSPFLGTHFIQAGAIAYLTRTNFIASLIGTFVGNPWTFPFIWWGAIGLGSYVMSFFGIATNHSLPEEMDFGTLWDLMLHDPFRIFLPWLIGGYLMALLIWPVAYGVFYQLVKGAKIARRKSRMRKVHKIAKEITGQKI